MKTKYEILVERPHISEEEIEAFKDFDRLLARQKTRVKDAGGRVALPRKFFLGLGLVIGLGIVLYSLKTIQMPHDADKNGVEQAGRELIQTVEEPTMDSALARSPNLETRGDKSVDDIKKDQSAKATPATTPLKEVTPTNTARTEAGEDNEDGIIEGKTPQQYIYTEAEPVNGLTALYAYFESELRYPTEALVDSVEGTSIVLFTITKDGVIDAISVEKSLGKAFDEEAKRLINNMPTWKPAMVNDVPVDSKVSIPLHFRIQK